MNIRKLKRAIDKAQAFSRLTLAEKLMLVQASALLIFLRVLLKWVPAHRMSLLIDRYLRKTDADLKDHLPFAYRVIWAVETAGHYVLRTRCLAEAFAARILLNRKRIRNQLKIGVIRNPHKQSAHAWLEADNEVIIGNNPLLPFYWIIPMPQRDVPNVPSNIK